MTTKLQPSNIDVTLNYSMNQLAANTVTVNGTDLFAFASAAYDTANNAGLATTAASAFYQANAAFIQANAVFQYANTLSPTDTFARNTGNAAFIQANTAVLDAGGASSYANASFVVANTAVLNSGSASSYANSAFIQSNASFVQANTAVLNSGSASSYANAAFLQANTAISNGQGASSYANAAFVVANTAVLNAASASSYANAAFAKANTGSSAGGLIYTASATKPATSNVGDQWYSTTQDILYEYLNVGTTNVWVDITSSSVSTNKVLAGGSNNQIQFNSNTNFSASPNLTFNATTNTLQVIGSLTSNNISYTNVLTTKSILETATLNGSAPASTENFDVLTNAVVYYTASASTNFTLNVRGNSTTSLDSIMSTGSSITVALLVTNGGTAYYPNVIQIDGTTVTPKWQGGTAISGGNTSAVDVYSFSIVKTGSATYTVLGSQTKFA